MRDEASPAMQEIVSKRCFGRRGTGARSPRNKTIAGLYWKSWSRSAEAAALTMCLTDSG